MTTTYYEPTNAPAPTSQYGPIKRDTDQSSSTYGQMISNPAYTGKPIDAFDPKTGKTFEPAILSSFGAKSALNQVQGVIQQGADATAKMAEANANAPEPIPPDMYEGETEAEKAKRLADEAFKTSQSAYDNLGISYNEEHQAELQGLKNTWGQLKVQQEEVNKWNEAISTTAQLRSGEARYTPIHSADVIAQKKSQGIAKLQDLDSKYQAAVASAKAAFSQKNSELAYKKAQEAQKYYQDSLTEVRAQEKEAREIAKENAEAMENAKEEEATTAETLANAIIGSGEKIDDDMLSLIAETNKVSPLSLRAAMTVAKSKYAKDATVGDLGQFNAYAEQFGVEKTKENFYDFLAQKATSKREPDEAGGGIAGGEVSGVVSRDAESVMSGVLNLQDISVKDNYRASVSAELKNKYNEALKTGDIYGAMKSSAVYDKEPSDTFLQSMEKTITVLSQIGVLQENINKEKTGPIVGAFRSANPWDTKAQVIKGQLNAIVPNLARGVYGEVGVLTDNDIKTYSKTIPTLTSTEDIRKAILYITVDQIRKSVEIKIMNQTAAQRDMSGYADIYKNLDAEATRILGTIKGGKKQEADVNTKTVMVNGKPVVYKKSGDKWIKQ